MRESPESTRRPLGFESWEAGEDENIFTRIEGSGESAVTIIRQISERDSDYRPLTVDQKLNQQEQQIRFSYPEAGGYIERDTIRKSPKEGEIGKVMQREHPGKEHDFSLTFTDPDAGLMTLSVGAELETLGHTLEKGNGREPYAHFRITDRESLRAFANLEQHAKPDGSGYYSVQNGNLGGGFSIDVYGRFIDIINLNKISVDYDLAGQPVKATIHCYEWSEPDYMDE